MKATQQIKTALKQYADYVEGCEQFEMQPELLEADFVLSKQQERGFKAYSDKAVVMGVEPVLADFLTRQILQKRTGELDPRVAGLLGNGLKWRTMAASAGR